LIEKDFSGHRAVEHVLNVHVQKCALIKDEWAKDKKSIEVPLKSMSNELSSLQSTVDKIKKKG